MVKKVGYGSPPIHSQWQKGQSGNPNGRAKGSVNFDTDLAAELGEQIAVTESGKPKRISKQRALIKALMAKAIKGDVRAANAIIGWTAKMLASGGDPAIDAALTPQEQAAFDDLVNRRAAARQFRSDEGEKL